MIFRYTRDASTRPLLLDVTVSRPYFIFRFFFYYRYFLCWPSDWLRGVREKGICKVLVKPRYIYLYTCRFSSCACICGVLTWNSGDQFERPQYPDRSQRPQIHVCRWRYLCYTSVATTLLITTQCATYPKINTQSVLFI